MRAVKALAIEDTAGSNRTSAPPTGRQSGKDAGLGCAVKAQPIEMAGAGNASALRNRFPRPLTYYCIVIYCIVIYCIVLARSAKLPTPPWPPAMRSTWMPIFWTPFTSAVVPGLAGGTCGAGLQMSVTKPSLASGM